tara:strand:+ start:657 stop:1079 length:423 start_codon:yes stop_codon:yes gene_type:complete
MRLIVNGDAVTKPLNAALIRDSINSLTGEGDSFAILEKSEQIYIQTSGGPEHGFVLEYRDGSEAQHYSCSNFELTADEVILAFQSYLSNDGKWRTELEWEPQVFDYSPSRQSSSLNYGVGLGVVGVVVAAILVWKFFLAT